jgi:ArsR family transcriptional regulator, lead/cadmium/zinc/bismuth-responsive transcriptional repressor
MSDDRCDLLCLDLEVAERVRAALIDVPGALLLAERAAALADPTRLRIAAALAGADELCVCDLAWISGRSDKLVSHHLRVLRNAGLAGSRRSGKIVFYQLTPLGQRMLDATLSIGVVTA